MEEKAQDCVCGEALTAQLTVSLSMSALSHKAGKHPPVFPAQHAGEENNIAKIEQMFGKVPTKIEQD